MVTIAQCLSRSKELESISDTARLDTEILLAKAVQKPRTFLYTWAEKNLSDSEKKQFEHWFDQRLSGKPIAYIIGEREFWSLELQVNDSTLIPRPDTELLVETALEILPQTPQTVLDLGTGTGAIALALASERPQWSITAVDNSVAAVHLAIENCRRLGFTNIEITRSDWYYNVGQKQFDAIVSNPPYIDEGDPHLKVGDVKFEPHSALVANNKGLSDIQTIIEQSHRYLNPQGYLMIEHGWKQGEDVRGLLRAENFSDVETRKDLSGNERVSIGCLTMAED